MRPTVKKQPFALLVALLLLAVACRFSSDAKPVPQVGGSAYATPAVPQKVLGQRLTIAEPPEQWQYHYDPGLGMSFLYPPGWRVEYAEGQFFLLPPDSSLNSPSPLISFRWFNLPFDPQRSVYGDAPKYAAVEAWIKPHQFYESEGLELPNQSAYYEVSHLGGVLCMRFDTGPNTDLTAVFYQVYNSISFDQ